jgi:hypothetical protein
MSTSRGTGRLIKFTFAPSVEQNVNIRRTIEEPLLGPVITRLLQSAEDLQTPNAYWNVGRNLDLFHEGQLAEH